MSNTPDAAKVELLFEKAREALQSVEENRQTIIKKLAEDLEYHGVPIDMICELITEELTQDGYVSKQYITRCLDEKYKNRKQIHKKVIDDGTTSLPVDDKKVLEVSHSVDGESITTTGIPETTRNYE